MLDRPRLPLRAVAAPPPPVEALVLGRTPADAAELLPRLFNLCRAAQEIAVRAALGLPVPDGAEAMLRREILRDHLMKLFVSWPDRAGLAPRPLPADWAEGGVELRHAVFGPAEAPPETGDGIELFLASGQGVAPVLATIAHRFAPGEAVVGELPAPAAETMLEGRAAENSVAARHAGHPAMRRLEERHGRGPLWRAVARLYDVAACLDETLPAHCIRPDRAVVPAARGLYAVSARVAEGRVTALTRITPTDHLLARGGILEQSLANLDPANAALLLDILDPCAPVDLKEAADA